MKTLLTYEILRSCLTFAHMPLSTENNTGISAENLHVMISFCHLPFELILRNGCIIIEPRLSHFIIDSTSVFLAGLAEGNYDVALTIEFPDKENYLAYAKHPEHVAAVQSNSSMVVSRAAIQFSLAPKL